MVSNHSPTSIVFTRVAGWDARVLCETGTSRNGRVLNRQRNTSHRRGEDEGTLSKMRRSLVALCDARVYRDAARLRRVREQRERASDPDNRQNGG